MYQWIKTLHSGFRDIGVIGDVTRKFGEMNVFPAVKPEQIVHINPADYIASLIENNSVELLVIDLDTLGVDKAGFLIFLATCLRPQTPLVLVTKRTLSVAEHRLLYTRGVLGIIELGGSLTTPQLACDKGE